MRADRAPSGRTWLGRWRRARGRSTLFPLAPPALTPASEVFMRRRSTLAQNPSAVRLLVAAVLGIAFFSNDASLSADETAKEYAPHDVRFDELKDLNGYFPFT